MGGSRRKRGKSSPGSFRNRDRTIKKNGRPANFFTAKAIWNAADREEEGPFSVTSGTGAEAKAEANQEESGPSPI